MSKAAAGSAEPAPPPGALPAEASPVDVPAPDEPQPKPVRGPLVWAYALTVGRFGITAGVTIVMAAFLDPRAYGVMALAMVWVSFAQGLALYGPAQAVIQREDVTSRHFDAAFWVAIGVASVETVLFVALAPLWAATNDAPDLVYVCWAIAPAILLNALVVVPDAILRRRLEFRRLSQRVLAAGIVSGVAGVVVAISGGGVWALVVQQLTLTGLSLVAIWSISPWRPSFGPVGPALRDLRKFSLHSVSEFFAQFLSAVLTRSCSGSSSVRSPSVSSGSWCGSPTWSQRLLPGASVSSRCRTCPGITATERPSLPR